MASLLTHPDRLFPSDPGTRSIARDLYAVVKDLPIISPHGHTDPAWFAIDAAWDNPTDLLLAPDHYLYRMLYSQGVGLDALCVDDLAGPNISDPREAWRLFAAHQKLFHGTPSRLWLDHVFGMVFGFAEALSVENADWYYDAISDALGRAEFRPRALFDRFGIELLATTEAAEDPLRHHAAIRASGWGGQVVTTYRPDAVIDVENEGFERALSAFGALAGGDVHSWGGYLDAHRRRRAHFRDAGAIATDHGFASAQTANLSHSDAEALFDRIVGGRWSPQDAELFRAQMLTEMARMSLDDGMVMQIHPGSCRNHNAELFARYGRDKGADIPMRTDYVHALKPMLDVVGNERDLTIILFTLDESTYTRELAPLAGHYPCLKLGPAWWFHDSPEGMRRFREMTTETAGFYNTVGFNDDTRAFLSIPARHDVSRRIDCGYLARLVAEHRLAEHDAAELAVDLAYRLAKRAYRIDVEPVDRPPAI